MVEFYHKLQTKTNTVLEFTDALQLIWSTLPEKNIDNAVKDFRIRLQACVSASGGLFEHIIVIRHITDTNSYI